MTMILVSLKLTGLVGIHIIPTWKKVRFQTTHSKMITYPILGEAGSYWFVSSNFAFRLTASKQAFFRMQWYRTVFWSIALPSTQRRRLFYPTCYPIRTLQGGSVLRSIPLNLAIYGEGQLDFTLHVINGLTPC